MDGSKNSMKNISFRSIDKLCRQLAAAGGANGVLFDRILCQGIQQRVVDKDSLPFIAQKLTTVHGSWALALRALESTQLDRHRITRDPGIWRTISDGLPKGDLTCRETTQRRLKAVYSRKPTASAENKPTVE